MDDVCKTRKTEYAMSKAYFTVEAALVVPIVISIIVFTVWIAIYQYNRCLLEQDIGIMAIYGSYIDEEEGDLKVQLEAKVRELYRGKYIGWNPRQFAITIKGNCVEICGSGEPKNLLAGWRLLNLRDKWSAHTKREIRRLHPELYLRLHNKLGGD